MNNKIIEFFKEFDINIDDLFSEEIITEYSSDMDIKMKLKDIEEKNNAHKILFAAGLLELRSQVKKSQEQISEIRKQLEKGFKDILTQEEEIIKKQEELSKNITLLREILYKLRP